MALCKDEEMNELLASIQRDGIDHFGLVERLIAAYPDDARLHFLRGSLLIGAGRAIEAHAALSRAVGLEPEFALARFQLGFFELTSGEPARALATWEPLDRLPADHYLALFVTGLRHLIRDAFDDAIAALTRGIAANTENPPLNHDIQLIVDECHRIAKGTGQASLVAETEETSATSFLLDQFASGTKH